MFILGVVTLGSSSLTLMEPTLPLYLQTTYKVRYRAPPWCSVHELDATRSPFELRRLLTQPAGDHDEHRPHVCGRDFGLWFCSACQWLAE
jgi:hypothetical protein